MHLTLVSQHSRRRHSRATSSPKSPAAIQGADPARRRPPRQLGPGHRRDRRRRRRCHRHRRGQTHHGCRSATAHHPHRLVRRGGAGRLRRQRLRQGARRRALCHGRGKRFRRRPRLAGQRASFEGRAAKPTPGCRGSGAARHHRERQGRGRRHRCRADDQRRRAVDFAQPGRHALFRLSTTPRRHARQDRSRPAPPERRRVDGDARDPVGRN